MNEAHDLIYADGCQYEIEGLIRKAFPNAEIEDASDFIHRGRFSVTIPNMRQDRFFIWLLAQGLQDMSFGVQIGMREDPERFHRIFRAAIRLQATIYLPFDV